MVDYTQPDDTGFANQPTHLGLHWDACGEELGERDDVRYLLSDPTVVPPQDWADRLYTNFSCLFMVSRVRATNDARVPRVELLQFYSDCIFRSSNIRDRRDAYLRRLRQRHSLLQSMLW